LSRKAKSCAELALSSLKLSHQKRGTVVAVLCTLSWLHLDPNLTEAKESLSIDFHVTWNWPSDPRCAYSMVSFQAWIFVLSSKRQNM